MITYKTGQFIECIDTVIPRIDGRGKCINVTEGKVYKVLSTSGHMVRIKCDTGKPANFLKIRFKSLTSLPNLV